MTTPSDVRRSICLLVLSALAAVAGGQTQFIGNPPYYLLDPSPLDATGEQTFVDLSAPASATGRVETGWISWAGSPCPATAKIKVFRPKGDKLIFVAERGPYDIVITDDEFFPYVAVPLEPAIEVQQGDLIGVSRVTDCGAPLMFPKYAGGIAHVPVPTEGLLRFEGDLTSDVAVSAGEQEASGYLLGAAGAGTPIEKVASVLPVVGSTPGAFDSHFRTALQLTNLGPEVSGRLVFHRAGTDGSSDDPALPFTIAPNSTFSSDDIVAAMGQTGIGTLDVILPFLGGAPRIMARVYADSEGGGTFGFSEEPVELSCCRNSDSVLVLGWTALLVAPSDPAHFRFNVGVRSLFQAPTLKFRVLGSGGTPLFEATKSYPPSSFVQQPVEALFGASLPANAIVQVEVLAGTAIVYGATVDNITNDPSIQIAKP